MGQDMRPDLVARYAGHRLPRYTSYPTAPHFTPSVDGRSYERWLAEIAAAAAASLYVHIPYCRRLCWYCGCNTAVSLRAEPIRRYVGTLGREVALIADRISSRLRVDHVHFGGGTPTIVDADDLRRLVDHLRAAFDISPSAELAIEIDPRVLSAEIASALADAGFTRASLGVQSLDPQVQAAINRRQSFAETASAVERLRKAGIAGINIDLIYGLPGQTVASCLDTVAACLALAPDRFAVFGYAHVPEFKRHQRRIDTARLPDGTARHDQAEAIAARLGAAGYVGVGLDHYARPSDTLAVAAANGHLNRNFQGYTTDRAPVLIGLGASAIGRLPQGYVQNAPVTRDYRAAIEAGRPATVRGHVFSAQDRLRGELIERLMCDFRVDVTLVCRRHGASVSALPGAVERLAALAADGVIAWDGRVVEVRPTERGLVRAVAAVFDAYRADSTTTHSLVL
jgi:oxygen-independent coproporphyrinogen-3 oxidase